MIVDAQQHVDLIADRFAVGAQGDAIDLATGERVVLVVGMIEDRAETARWAARCEWFATLHHRDIARLVDYGALGDRRRFEAWRAAERWGGAVQAGEQARERAVAFLAANGLAANSIAINSVHRYGAQPIVVPDAAAGYPSSCVSLASAHVSTTNNLGLQTISQPAVASLNEILTLPPDRRTWALALAGPPGSGLRTAFRDVARAARLHGFIPLSTRLVRSRVAAVVEGRSIVLLACSGDRDGWRALLTSLPRRAKPHIVVFGGATPLAGVRSLRLTRVDAAVLERAALPADLSPRLQRSIARFAERSRGWPGRFANLVWGNAGMPGPDDRTTGISRAAEASGTYGEPAADRGREESETSGKAPARPLPWPTPASVMAIRKRMTDAVLSLSRGRHAQADRTLREVRAAFLRRGDTRSAAEASIVLGRSLLKRGRTRDARDLLSEAKTSAGACGDDTLLLQIAILLGIAAVDEVRLDEGDALLSGATTAAAGLNHRREEFHARVAWARCHFWRGSFDDGWSLLSSIETRALDDAQAIQLAVERSRLAVGRRDFETAVSAATAALLRAERVGDAGSIALAAGAAAFAHLGVGDHVSTIAAAAQCVAAARRAHDPLLAVRGRLIGAESERRQGHRRAAVALIRRMRRLAHMHLPPILAARADLLADLVDAPAESDVVGRRVKATGLGGLALFVPSPPALPDGTAIATDIVAILQCCHAADDEPGVLAGLCARLRSTLRAAAVGFWAEERGQLTLVAADGGRLDGTIAARLMAIDCVMPCRGEDDRLEGGAPVRYGGKRLGALIARWTPAHIDFVSSSDATMLLTTAAAAAAPALAAFVSKRAAAPLAVGSELIGTSESIATVRRAIERAAPAPFAVLVEGESGSGKELVARALHRAGLRRDRPFCTLNCAALPDDLVESELFGHARGAFTGAVNERPGVFEESHTGTLFLDEVGELSLRAQAKVLRTVQDGELRRVGENVARRVDVRLVAATNRDLRHEVSCSRFRLDLLYRLDVIRIALPPLRERREDIPLLAEHFWREATARLGSRATLGVPLLARLARYDWPGNVRELQNVLAALAVRSPRRGVIGPSALPPQFDGPTHEPLFRLDAARRTFEAGFIRAALARAGGHRGRAAEELGVTRQGLSKLMTRLGIVV
jgi:DNA-binding NtrC family response regulator